VPYKDKKKVAADLKKIYTAVDRDHAESELERFAETWDHKYPMISASWIENWERIVPFLAFPPDVRRAVYTTNTIEALNRQIRKIIKTVRHERRRRSRVEGPVHRRNCARDGGSMALRRRPCGGRRQTALELR
jgi:transposase-like protein